ncbi:MAG: hypothetical protein A2Y10_06035 [Planctomycetes bacterium GWF2_41_51]|nr:MAG: hypothetical protein A2Y10_06035 [Planctomycetes bacterium GWF2_41_51]
MECSQCRKKLELGVDVITVEKSVLGPRGIVPLGEIEYFCCEACIADFYSNVDIPHIDRRIP